MHRFFHSPQSRTGFHAGTHVLKLSGNKQPVARTSFKSAILFACSLLILFSESILAQSSPPLLTNDPGTPGPGNWEINVLTSFEHSAVNDEWLIPLLDFNYGVGDRWQLTASMPFVIGHAQGAGVRRTFDGIELGVKYRFVDSPGKTGSNFSLYPKVYFSFVEEKSMKLSLPLEWHREWSHFGLTAELGHVWVNGESDGWEGGVAAALFLDPVSIQAEGHTEVREAPFDLRGPMVNFGFTWEWSKTVSLFASFGKSLKNHEEAPTWTLAGFQFRF
ncbi:MAG: hypothetical protein NTZ35_10945 [Ignavibacteriales bacterium]|nr:hypothetical protein [Ignavibacteriales bacterium]